jgi:hypothetical protein
MTHFPQRLEDLFGCHHHEVFREKKMGIGADEFYDSGKQCGLLVLFARNKLGLPVNVHKHKALGS